MTDHRNGNKTTVVSDSTQTTSNGQLVNTYQSQISLSSTNASLNNTSPSLTPSVINKRMFQVRRTFLLIVTFDAIFMALLWIIYKQIKNITIDEAFIDDVVHYSIQHSLFDVVGLSILRFIILMIFYAILKWSHWFFVAFTTLASTGFIIAKTCLFTTTTDRSFTDYSVLIVSFILAWVEIWFFDYRVIPHERRLRQALHNNDRRPLIASNTSRSTSPVPTSPIPATPPNYQSLTMSNDHRQSFYSPIPSPEGSDSEETYRDPERFMQSESNVSRSVLGTPSFIEEDENEQDYESQADDVIEKVWRIFLDNDSWSQEAKSVDGKDVVFSKTFPKWGKVFRLASIIPTSRDELVEFLYDRQEDMSKWNPTVNDCRILKVINQDLYIGYQITNEQAQGIIAKRDFVNITTRRFIDDVAILAAQACVYAPMPPKDNCVRGENGPTGYIIEKIDEGNCRFTWILNVDLKGWLPQYIINSSLAGAQMTMVESLRSYLTRTADLMLSCASTIGDSST